MKFNFLLTTKISTNDIPFKYSGIFTAHGESEMLMEWNVFSSVLKPLQEKFYNPWQSAFGWFYWKVRENEGFGLPTNNHKGLFQKKIVPPLLRISILEGNQPSGHPYLQKGTPWISSHIMMLHLLDIHYYTCKNALPLDIRTFLDVNPLDIRFWAENRLPLDIQYPQQGGGDKDNFWKSPIRLFQEFIFKRENNVFKNKFRT